LENVEVPIYNDDEVCSLVILDAFSSNIKGFLNLLFTNYTDTIKYFGGFEKMEGPFLATCSKENILNILNSTSKFRNI